MLKKKTKKRSVGFFLIIFSNNRHSLVYMCTAETWAIYHALKIISSSNTTNYSIIISDSLSTLTLISNPYPRNEIVKHIQKLIYEINNPTCFMWISSHVGILKNEKTEMIVLKVILSPLSIQINTSSSFEMFIIINQKIMKEWRNF